MAPKKSARRADSTKALQIAGYIRVSSQRQASEGDSLVAQQHQIENEIDNRKVRDSWNVQRLELYIDAGKSAKDQNRPELQRLKRDIAAGKIDIVICFKLDRVTRSLPDFIELWQLFEEHDVNVISLREQFDTTSPTGRAMLKLIMVFAELEREMTAERTFATMRDRVDRGLWNGGHVLGYLSDPKEPGRLLVDPEWAPIIQEQFFNAFEKLGSSTEVLKRLNELNLKTPVRESRAGKIRGGQVFTKQKVVDILRNPIYIGRVHWGEATCDDSHEAIISPEQFARVQARLGETTRHRRNHKYSRGRSYLLRGIVRCSCGAHMTPQGAQGRSKTYHYYVCTRQLHEGGTVSCAAPRIPAEPLEAAVLLRIRELGALEIARDKIVEQAAALLDDEGTRLAGEEEIARRQLSKIRGEINRLLEVLKSLGADALTSIKDELSRLETEEKHLVRELRRLADRQRPIERINEQARKFLQTWQGVAEILDQASADEQRQIIQHFIEVVELTATTEKKDVGTYSLKLFPEANPTAAEHASKNDQGPSEINLSERPVLTENDSVLQLVGKAPRIGLEPIT